MKNKQPKHIYQTPPPSPRDHLNEQIEDQRINLPPNLTPQQRRTQLHKQCNPYRLYQEATTTLIHQYTQQKHTQGQHGEYTLQNPTTRDDTHGIYIGTHEHWQAQHRHHTPHGSPARDPDIIRTLTQQQPHRIALALTPNNQPPQPTYAPLMQPQSHDPLQPPQTTPPIEQRPPQWHPNATPHEITNGTLHEILNITATLTSRLKIAIGHLPDTQAITQLHQITKILQNTQNIQKQNNPTPKKTSPGRPPKTYTPTTIQITTLQLQNTQKHKKHGNRKNPPTTPTKSTNQLPINPNPTPPPNPNQINHQTPNKQPTTQTQKNTPPHESKTTPTITLPQTPAPTSASAWQAKPTQATPLTTTNQGETPCQNTAKNSAQPPKKSKPEKPTPSPKP